MEQLLHKKDVVSVVLYGSMAKGTFNIFSDYDVLIVVKEDPDRFIDRLWKYGLLSDGYVEPVVYTLSEIKMMFQQNHLLLLEALKDGIPLYDTGLWKTLQKEFEEKLEKREIVPKEQGWIINA
jgi:predicted nucleotidyltransferase